MKAILLFIFILATVSQTAVSDSTSKTPESLLDRVKQDNPKNLVFADQFPEVLAVRVSQAKNKNWRFNVTLSSLYDTPKRYADAWRVLDADDNELGIRILGHDHANEQPFTRSKTIEVPKNIDTVFVEGRDQKNGWSGQRFEVNLR